jgi:WD40 repeat protein
VFAGGVAFHPDGERLLTVSRQTIEIRRAADLTVVLSIRVPGDVAQAAFAPDGGRIVAGVDNTVQIWEAATGDLLGRFPMPARVAWAAFDATGDRVIAADASGRATAWDARLEARSPADIAELVRCRVPFEWSGDHMVPKPVASGCHPPDTPAR